MPLLFLDTEFTDFVNPELISIGIVDENGREFYAESTSFRREACSEFVKETVIPLLGQYPSGIVGTKQHIAYRLSHWLEEYREWEDGVIICVDYQTDWDLLVDLLAESQVMEFITADNIWKDLDLQKIEDWWKQTDYPRHMALYDAMANRHGYSVKKSLGE
jgi:hypothetical protein